MSSGIGSISTGSMHRPDPKDFFKKIDSDGSGDISPTELKALSDKVKEMSGDTLDAGADAFATYDSDSSGTLSADELKVVLDSNNGAGSSRGMEGMPPPPPPRVEQAAASYADNSGEDTLTSVISTLKKLLEQLQSESATGTSNTTTTAASTRKDPQDFFNKVDGDSSGAISKDELKTLAENLNKMTGQSIAVDDSTFAALDSDSDGSLNSEELKSFMDKSGFAPPPPPPGGMAMAPPPEDDQSQSTSSTSSTASSSSSDLVAQLQALLEKLSKSYASKTQDSADSLLSISG